MNLYPISPDPKECAKYIDTKRLGWVCIKESAQLISTSLWELYGEKSLVKPTHANHPVSKWVRERLCNLQWTIKYFEACHLEYKKRRGKEYNINGYKAGLILESFGRIFSQHITFFQAFELQMLPHRLNELDFCNYAKNKSLNIDYTHIKNTHRAYRLYLAHRWITDKITPTWE